MKRPAIKDSLKWCLTLRCPVCGKGSIVQKLFRISDSCLACDASFKREEGFFVGAILISVVTTEALLLLVYLISIPVFNFQSQRALSVLFVIAILFPIAFYHHGWSLWLTFDHMIEGLPKKRVRPR